MSSFVKIFNCKTFQARQCKRLSLGYQLNCPAFKLGALINGGHLHPNKISPRSIFPQLYSLRQFWSSEFPPPFFPPLLSPREFIAGSQWYLRLIEKNQRLSNCQER